MVSKLVIIFAFKYSAKADIDILRGSEFLKN